MIILKELDRITKPLEQQTACSVEAIDLYVRGGMLILWVTLYDSGIDIKYETNVQIRLEHLTQFSNDRIIREITEQLVLSWTEDAHGQVTVH